MLAGQATDPEETLPQGRAPKKSADDDDVTSAHPGEKRSRPGRVCFYYTAYANPAYACHF